MNLDIEVSSGREKIIKITYIFLIICQKIKFHLHHLVFHDVWPAWFCLVFRNYPANDKVFLKKMYLT